MKLNSNQLSRHLNGDLLPIYVVSGDDPLLSQEACDAIRQQARSQGFSERDVFHVDNQHFDWSQVLQAGNSLSLFADKRLMELRIANGKPGDSGAKAILSLLERPPEDTLLLLILPKLDGTTARSKWAKALQESPASGFIQLWPIEAHQLPQWISQRLAQGGLSATPEAIEVLCQRVEGNLLAAAQEVEKLKLLADGTQVTLDTIQASVGESARYDVFGLVDALLAGDAEHVLRMLQGLRGEGVEPPVLLWALSRELRNLASLAQLTNGGLPFDRACSQMKPPIWDKRKPLVSRALNRLSSDRWSALLQDAQHIDAQIKGQAAGDPWLLLSQVCLKMCGKKLKLPSARLY
ncbi:DNA polymerase III subunit delta [Atopomonas sediminilitoris]|uniref:DNA polymerase III subunit delta n=1 Tax=Atopomonas sediminilitoris TaxID=2919919 RepID=UPI001F4D3CD3|nr:DNA polymerase III subunit delta [Atopomonas sediminilitoris]MCJ8170662.1 DNA polymerase III subunit delta [Atopomonas sediminilitoris]